MNRSRNWKHWMRVFACSALAMALNMGDATAQTVRSEEGDFEATFDERKNRVSVYRVDGEKRRKRKQWYTIDGRLDDMYLSKDGRHLVSCRHRLQSDFRTDEVIVRVFRTGILVRSIGLNEVVKKPRELRSPSGNRLTNQRVWGNCIGFISDGHRFQLHGGDQFVTINLKHTRPALSLSETMEEARPPSLGEVENPKINIRCDQWAEVFPIMCDDLDEQAPGWRQVRGKWEFVTESDQDKVLYQRSDDPRERNALMYFDNLSLSDFNVLTYVKLQPEFPAIAISEDEQQVRRLRRIAGAGLVFRMQDENNYYMFRLAGLEGAVLGKMVDGEWHNILNPRAIDFLTQGKILDPDQWLGLRVRVQGDSIQAWIVENTFEGDWQEDRWQAVANIRDSTFSTGHVGFTTFEIKAKFSNIIVLNP